MDKLEREANRILARQQDRKPRRGTLNFFKSRPWKTAGRAARKVLFYTLLTGGIAIGGANLGTYFSYNYHNHEYQKMPNGTKLELADAVENSSIVKAALVAAKIRIVGSVAPQEAKVDIMLISGRETGNWELETHYTLVWNTNKGMKKRDEEIMNIRWKFDSGQGRFVPLEAMTRYHYKTVKMPLSGIVPAIVIQNPAHTPGIPGYQVRFDGPIGLVGNFTLFSAEEWAGSSLACGWPDEFRAMDVTLKTKVEVVKRVEDPAQPANNLK